MKKKNRVDHLVRVLSEKSRALKHLKALTGMAQEGNLQKEVIRMMSKELIRIRKLIFSISKTLLCSKKSILSI